MKPIAFTVQGEKISGNLFLPTQGQSKQLAFLFLHGWMGHQYIDAAKVLESLGFACLTYSMRGNGESEGDPAKIVKEDFLGDAVIAYDFLRQHVGGAAKIGVVGSSFGSYLGIRLAELRDVYCMSLRVPANYPDETMDQTEPTGAAVRRGLYGDWRRKKLDTAHNKALAALHAFGGPVQIIESGEDEQIPHQTVVNYINAMVSQDNLTYDVMKGAPHSLSSEKLQAEYVTLLTNWVMKLKDL